jgi:hypothetical protein
MEMREDLLLFVEKQHDTLAWHQSRGELPEIAQDIPWTADM